MLAKFGSLRPSFSVVFYQHKTSLAPIATVHQIDNGVLGSGRTVSADEIASIVQREDAKRASGLLPANTVATTDDYFLFYRPSSYQTMWYRLHGEKSYQLRRRVPALLWRVRRDGRETTVYALKQSRFPGRDTDLYVAPFMNCTGPDICWGSAKPKLKNAPVTQWPEIIEDTFFNHSVFSHTGSEVTLLISGKPENGNVAVYKWWRDQPERNNRFKASALSPLNKQLKDIVDE